VSQETIFFLSDVHLGATVPGFEQRQDHLLAFLRSITPQASHLFLVGDIFDFWIEYRKLIRADYFQLLFQLKQMTQAGVEVHYLAGNHDFALGPFLRTQIGCTIHPSPVTRELQGHRVHIIHGDGLLKRDIGYPILKALLRNRFNQFLYKLIHPSLGIFLAEHCSHASRLVNRSLLQNLIRTSYRKAARLLFKQGTDIVIMGHTHFAELVTGDGKTYCNTGEWLRTFSYARMDKGTLHLLRHVPGGIDQPFESLSWNNGKSAS